MAGRVWKRAVLVSLAALSLAALAGCEGREQTAEAPREEEKITLTWMAMGTMWENSDMAERLEERLQACADEIASGVEIQVFGLPDEQYYAALKLRLAAGTAPDFISVQGRHAGENSVIRLAKAGYLEPLFDLDDGLWGADVVREGLSYQGTPYALGREGLFILGTTYNKKLFAEYGLQIPGDWEEFLACCETLKTHGVVPITMGDRDAYVTQWGLYQLAANVVYAKQPDFDRGLWNGETRFTDPGTWDEVIEMYGELYARGYMDEASIKMGHVAAEEKFHSGGAAMTFSIGYEDSGEFGTFPLPGNAKGQETYLIADRSGNGTAVNAASEHKDLCKKILELYYSQMEPVDRDSWPREYAEAVEKGTAVDTCNRNWPSGTENELEKLFLEYVCGKKLSVVEVTEGVQRRLEALIERYGGEE